MTIDESARLLVKIEGLRQEAKKAENLSKLYVKRSRIEQGRERERYVKLAEEQMKKALKAKEEITKLKAEAREKAKKQKPARK